MNTQNSNYKYKAGFFGGKFIPLHKGHALCISVALALCETVHVLLFINGDGELDILQHDHKLPKEYLSVESRVEQIKKLIGDNPRIKFHVIDVMQCKNADGTEDWDAETPLVLDACGDFQAVFSSEPSYDEYFKRAYPWAEHVIVDAKREKYPISATMIRDMTPEEAAAWII